MTDANDNNSEDIDVARAKQGKVTGVIIPPPEIRAVVDKTAQFVARNGKSFEKRILESGEGKTSKFNFMKAYDPYHAYYEFKISEFEGGGGDGGGVPGEDSTPRPSTVTDIQAQAQGQDGHKREEKQSVQTFAQTTAAAKATISTPLARFALMKVTSETSPPPMEFSAGHPSGLGSLDTDIMKLAAQYTALNGREFLSGLAQREQRNPQFDFLKPTHMLFSYFTSLVDAYAKLLQPPVALLASVKEKSTLLGALEKSVGRWVWERAEEERKRKEVKEADAERSALQSIDWYDFSIVETIEFDDDELYEPASGVFVEEGGHIETEATRHVEEQEGDVDMDMDMDMDEDEDEGDAGLLPPPPPLTLTGGLDDDVIDEGEDEDDAMQVVTDYTPRTAALSKGEKPAPAMMIDPISGKAIAVDQMTEHMRVQLMDPRWRIEQQRFLDKQQETGFAEGSSIADSLRQFARQRGDICGSAEEEEARLLADEGKRKKRVEETNRIIWDGHQSSIESVKRQKREQQDARPRDTETAATIAMSSAVRTSGGGGGRVVGPVVPPVASSTPAQFFQAPPPTAPHHPLPPPPLSEPQLHGTAPLIHPTQVACGGGNEIGMAPPATSLPPTTIPFNHVSHAVKTSQTALIPEDEFASRFPSPVTIIVRIPLDTSATWELRGQSLSVSISVTQSVKDLKDCIGVLIGGMPSNKQQLKSAHGFLKDKETLAALNIGPETTLELSVRSRGGKR